MSIKEGTLTLTVLPESGEIYNANGICILTWVFDHPPTTDHPEGDPDKYYANWKNNKNLGLDLLKGDGLYPEGFRWLQTIGGTSSFVSGNYGEEKNNIEPYHLSFTLPEGLEAGNYKLRVGDFVTKKPYPSSSVRVIDYKNSGLGETPVLKKIRGITNAFEVDAHKILTLDTPEADVEWTLGKAEDIKWTLGEGWDATDTIDIYYRKKGISLSLTETYPWTLIASEVDPTDESYTWNIPPIEYKEGTSEGTDDFTLVEPGEYQIGILHHGAISDEDKLNIADNADKYFMLATRTDSFVLVGRSITFTTPAGDDNMWTADSEQTIEWDQVGFSLDDGDGNAIWADDITLYYRESNKDGRKEIAPIDADSDDDGTGSYAWTLPDDIEEKSYVIVAVDSYGVLVGTSGQFTIVAKDIAFTAPVQGSSWHIDDTVAITWTFTGYADDDTVVVSYGVSPYEAGDYTEIEADVAISDGTIGWNTTDLPEASYKIKIVRGDDSYVSDLFSLYDPVAAFNSIERRTHLVAVSDNKVYYSDADSHEMTQVTSSVIAPDTPAVAIIPAYQKVFIGDGQLDGLFFVDMANVKVAGAYGASLLALEGCTYTKATGVINKADAEEFTDGAGNGYKDNRVIVWDDDNASWTANSYVITASTIDSITIASDIGDPATDIVKIKIVDSSESQFTRGAVLTGGGVTAIFDHGDATNIYIYRTTAHTVAEADELTDGTSTFTANHDEYSPPFWLTWTANSGLGSLPDSATIGCLYRGRLVLAGDRKNPHMWYMSRAGDPFDWLYASADAASPVAGGDGDVGEVGDIITALVPYHDDYLIIGCNQSLWLMRGDPAAGGSLDSLTSADGIFGPHSWCFDANNILYYVGLGGVYALAPGELPRNLTSGRIPSFMTGVNREQHWITMVFDVRRNGILIHITKIDRTVPTDYGTGESWWLDLRTGGFFPEEYPQESMPFSSLYYGSEDADYEQLIIGCHDGNIRCFDEATKDDDGVPIDAYALYPPQRLSNLGREGKLNKIIICTGGGDSNSDNMNYEIYTGDTAQEVLEDVTADVEDTSRLNKKAKFADSIAGVVREVKRPRCRGQFAAIKVTGSNAVDESFAVESIVAEITDGGRVK